MNVEKFYNINGRQSFWWPLKVCEWCDICKAPVSSVDVFSEFIFLQTLFQISWFSGSLKISLCEGRKLEDTQNIKCEDRRLQNCLALKTEDLATKPKDWRSGKIRYLHVIDREDGCEGDLPLLLICESPIWYCIIMYGYLHSRNYVNIIIKTSEKDGLLLDGSAVTETFNSLSLIAGDNITHNCWVSLGIPVGRCVLKRKQHDTDTKIILSGMGQQVAHTYKLCNLDWIGCYFQHPNWLDINLQRITLIIDGFIHRLKMIGSW